LSTIGQLPESPYAAPDVTGDTMTWRGDSRAAWISCWRPLLHGTQGTERT